MSIGDPMSSGDRMCARSTCERVGLRTTAKRCELCGFVTQPWNDDRSEQLRNPPDFLQTRARAFRRGMPVATSNDLPGWEITMYLGEVFGLVVRSRGAFPQLGAKLGAMFGGELGAMTDLLRETRQHAIARLVEDAEQRGADAVIAMRFDVTSMGDSAGWTEVCAYGTAVAATPIATSGSQP
jgi:uncharacterized protein YbjQ (UPF0145 family)